MNALLFEISKATGRFLGEIMDGMDADEMIAWSKHFGAGKQETVAGFLARMRG